jgi:ABC-2 type transport system permease protein
MGTMMNCWFMSQRLLKHLLRQPWYILYSLGQPVVWLFFVGQLFTRVSDLPGFRAASYTSFITPGIIVMSALLASSFVGMGIVTDIDRGVMDRFMVSPASAVSIVISRMAQLTATLSTQCVVLVGLGALFGGNPPSPIGICSEVGITVVLGLLFGSLSMSLALIIRKQESIIAATNFVMMPLTFLAPAYMSTSLMPAWMQRVSRFNPVSWALDACRASIASRPDWPEVAALVLRLTALLVCGYLCLGLAFRKYRANV